MSETYEDTITKLSPAEENKFMAWAGQMRIEGKIHQQDDFSDYDMRGYWKETNGKTDLEVGGNFPDKYKRPNHPTFSTESKYAQGEYKDKYGDLAGTWSGDEFLPPVSEEELYNTYNKEQDDERIRLYQKQQIEDMYGIEMEDEDFTTNIQSKAIGNLAGKTTEEIADSKDMSPSFVETLCDVSYGLFNGLYNFGVSIQELGMAGGHYIAEKRVGEDIDFDPVKENKNVFLSKINMPEPVTTQGKFFSAASQATAGFLATPELKIAGVAKTAYGAKFLNGLSNVVRGFTADTMAFSANESNFAELLKEYNLPTIETLAKQKDDSFLTKKIKNGLDGAVVGLAVDALINSSKMFYKAGKQALENRRVYEGILEHPYPTKYYPNIVDVEFTEIKPINKTKKQIKQISYDGDK